MGVMKHCCKEIPIPPVTNGGPFDEKFLQFSQAIPGGNGSHLPVFLILNFKCFRGVVMHIPNNPPFPVGNFIIPLSSLLVWDRSPKSEGLVPLGIIPTEFALWGLWF